VGATWGHRPHNFLAVGAIAPIAPMESAPMFSWQMPKRYGLKTYVAPEMYCFSLIINQSINQSVSQSVSVSQSIKQLTNQSG